MPPPAFLTHGAVLTSVPLRTVNKNAALLSHPAIRLIDSINPLRSNILFY